MIIETIDKNNISKNMSESVGLCYFDPETEELKEFSPEETINLTPFEHSVRRFYFVKTAELINNVRPIYVKLTAISNILDIEVKLNVGNERLTSKYDFYDTEINNTVICFFQEYPSGIIPIDLYFKSNTNRELQTDFMIKISVE